MRKNAQKIIFAGCLFAVLYGVLNSLSNIFLLPSAPFISLRPQVVLPMIVGIIWHPFAGFVTGFAGNIIGDGISGFGVWKFWNWHIANGLMGLIPGLIRYLGISRIISVRDFGILQMSVVMSSAISVALAVVLDFLFLHQMVFPSSFHSWILPAFLTDAVNGFVLVPVILILAGRIIYTLEIRTILMVTTLLIASVLFTAGAITWAILDDVVSYQAMVENFYISAVVSVFLLIVGFAASVVFVRKLTDPLADLAQAAKSVEEGNYCLESLEVVSRRKDELGRLSRVFEKMAGKVQEREKKLQRQVEELQIKIDRKMQAQEVSEIVETEYFKILREKARKFRAS